jgi:hypothetical protein
MSLTFFENTEFEWSRQSAVINPQGAAVQSFALVPPRYIDGSIQPASSSTVAFYAVEGMQCTHTVFTTQQGFQPGDNLTADGVTYSVLGEKPYKRFAVNDSYSAVDVRQLKV